MKKNLFLIFALLCMVAQGAWADTFVTDVMLVGAASQADAVSWRNGRITMDSWSNDGVDKDLNDAAGGHYIYLLYKTSGSSDNAITDFYLRVSDSNDAQDEIELDGHTYTLVPIGNGDATFNTEKGNLNCGTSGKYIHLYYTKEALTPERKVVSMTINTNSVYSLGENGSTTDCDLNKGAGGDYIYLHVYSSLNIVHDEASLRHIAGGSTPNILLKNDIKTSAILEVTGNKTVTVDLGGFTIDRGCTSRGSQAFVVRSGSTLNLTGGTVTGGWGGKGGALDIESGATANLTNVTISGNHADNRGGGISNYGTLNMTGGAINDNTCYDQSGDEKNGGGGLFNRAGATATLNDVDIRRNTTELYGGGGICNYGVLYINGADITDNHANTSGGGIWQEGELYMQDAVIVKNNTGNANIADNLFFKESVTNPFHAIRVTGSLASSDISVNTAGQIQ